MSSSSRGKSALPLFIEYLKTIDSSCMEFEWQQPKNNKIFDQLTADSLKDTGTFAHLTLIQDGNQIESRWSRPASLNTFIPKWAEGQLGPPPGIWLSAPQTLNKGVYVQQHRRQDPMTTAGTLWPRGEHGLFMDIDSGESRGQELPVYAHPG